MKLLIINQAQFGYHTDSYYYCKYLKDEFDINYLCWDHGLPKIKLSGVQVFYLNRKNNILLRNIKFLKNAIRKINNNRTIVFINYFKVTSLILRFIKPHSFLVLDIRTASVVKSASARALQNLLMRFETIFFNNITIISQNLAKKLGIAHKSHIIPLGADVISSSQKNFENIHLLYVGTLFNRNIDKTICGFKLFCDEFKNKLKISYTIIGTGPNNEEVILRSLVKKYNLSEYINVTGQILHVKLKKWFDKANIGISYIPITDYYNYQPVTKTFEYLMSGMPVIATDTTENRKIINPYNGVLVGETSKDIYLGLKHIFLNRNIYDSGTIRKTVSGNTWEKIITGNLKVYLNSISH